MGVDFEENRRVFIVGKKGDQRNRCVKEDGPSRNNGPAKKCT